MCYEPFIYYVREHGLLSFSYQPTMYIRPNVHISVILVLLISELTHLPSPYAYVIYESIFPQVVTLSSKKMATSFVDGL